MLQQCGSLDSCCHRPKLGSSAQELPPQPRKAPAYAYTSTFSVYELVVSSSGAIHVTQPCPLLVWMELAVSVRDSPKSASLT